MYIVYSLMYRVYKAERVWSNIKIILNFGVLFWSHCCCDKLICLCFCKYFQIDTKLNNTITSPFNVCATARITAEDVCDIYICKTD